MKKVFIVAIMFFSLMIACNTTGVKNTTADSVEVVTDTTKTDSIVVDSADSVAIDSVVTDSI